MSLKQRAFDLADRFVDRRLLAAAGSVLLSARSGRRCSVRYDGGDWIHRYPDGVVVNTRLGGPTPDQRARHTDDVFLFSYRPAPDDIVVDIGAGVGGEVCHLSRLIGSRGRVVSVEAHPRISRCLRRTVEYNGLSNVTAVGCAVVGEPGPVFIEDDVASHIRNRLTTEDRGGIEVVGRTLDEILRSLGIDHVDLLKMNIEGAELGVLEASVDALKGVDNLVVSCHDFLADSPDRAWQRTFAPVTALLRSAGYTIRTRPDDPRPWVRYYVYAARHPAPGRAATGWPPD